MWEVSATLEVFIRCPDKAIRDMHNLSKKFLFPFPKDRSQKHLYFLFGCHISARTKEPDLRIFPCPYANFKYWKMNCIFETWDFLHFL